MQKYLHLDKVFTRLRDQESVSPLSTCPRHPEFPLTPLLIIYDTNPETRKKITHFSGRIQRGDHGCFSSNYSKS